jgi:hypothetical protein
MGSFTSLRSRCGYLNEASPQIAFKKTPFQNLTQPHRTAFASAVRRIIESL